MLSLSDICYYYNVKLPKLVWKIPYLGMTNIQQNTIELLKKGDQSVFEKLYKQFFNGLYFFAIQYIDDKNDAENMVQETFMSLWINRENLHGKRDNSIKSWLYNTIKNKCINTNGY